MINIAIPDFTDKACLYDWLVTNKSLLFAQKKSAIKQADSISFPIAYVTDKGGSVVKSESIPESATRIKVRSIINTTKLFDSHYDVHIDQLWNKSLKESNELYLTKEHDLSFDGVITDQVKAFVKQMSWTELGFNYSGQTQALVFDSVIEMPKRLLTKNEIVRAEMFELYRTNKVRQHSAGMRYYKIDLAVNDDRYEKEYAVWKKYYDIIVNKTDVDDVGYFWPVTEAKIFEGAAVVKGANFATPTQSVQETKGQPSTTLDDEPLPSTRKNLKLLEALNNLSKQISI